MLKIYLNVTSSYQWDGAPVGIVRTEIEILKSLKKTVGINLRLFIVEDNLIIPISFEEYYEKKQKRASHSSCNNESKHKWLFPLVSKKQAIKLLAQSTISLAPAIFRPFLNDFAMKAQFLLGRLNCLRVKYLMNKKIKHHEREGGQSSQKKMREQDVFDDGDVILTCGLDWNIPDFFEELFFLKKRKNLKLISFCYDLIPVYYPQYCAANTVPKFSKYFFDLIKASDLVCCISQCTKKDLLKFASENGIPSLNTNVVCLGSDFADKKIPASERAGFSESPTYRTDIPFLLYVSTIERRKNHEVIYRAYRKIILEGNGDKLPDLYFVGMRGWGVEDFLRDLSLDPLIKNKIKLLGRVNDEQLATLYKKCKFVLFPSFYEGWGLGVGEALAYGKFVLCSNSGSLPEVGSEFAEYIDPLRVDLWAKKILFYSCYSEALAKKEEYIKDNWRPRSWSSLGHQVCCMLTEFKNSTLMF